MPTLVQAEKRLQPRLRPRGLVSLAIYQGEWIPPAYAIVNDISERGLCIVSDRILARDQNVQLRIQFESEADLFEAAGRVAWTRPAIGEESLLGGARMGVELALLSYEAEHRLRQVLLSPSFELPATRSREFDDLIASLKPELEQLGDQLVERSRRLERKD